MADPVQPTVAVGAELVEPFVGGRCVVRVDVVIECFRRCRGAAVSSSGSYGKESDLPVLRHPDGHIYVKEEVHGLLMGGFDPWAKPWGTDGIPDGFAFSTLAEDWEKFEVLMTNAVRRLPALETAEVRTFLNGPESFTPDSYFIMGEAPEVRRYYVAAGFSSGASARIPGRSTAGFSAGGFSAGAFSPRARPSSDGPRPRRRRPSPPASASATIRSTTFSRVSDSPSSGRISCCPFSVFRTRSTPFAAASATNRENLL